MVPPVDRTTTVGSPWALEPAGATRAHNTTAARARVRFFISLSQKSGAQDDTPRAAPPLCGGPYRRGGVLPSGRKMHRLHLFLFIGVLGFAAPAAAQLSEAEF